MRFASTGMASPPLRGRPLGRPEFSVRFAYSNSPTCGSPKSFAFAQDFSLSLKTPLGLSTAWGGRARHQLQHLKIEIHIRLKTHIIFGQWGIMH